MHLQVCLGPWQTPMGMMPGEVVCSLGSSGEGRALCQAFCLLLSRFGRGLLRQLERPVCQPPRRQQTYPAVRERSGGCGISSALSPPSGCRIKSCCSEFSTDKMRLMSKVSHHIVCSSLIHKCQVIKCQYLFNFLGFPKIIDLKVTREIKRDPAPNILHREIRKLAPILNDLLSAFSSLLE